MSSMNNSTEDVRRSLALKDLGHGSHPSDIAYHVAWIAGMTQAEFDAYEESSRNW